MQTLYPRHKSLGLEWCVELCAMYSQRQDRAWDRNPRTPPYTKEDGGNNDEGLKRHQTLMATERAT
jgi:hypothetical protein